MPTSSSTRPVLPESGVRSRGEESSPTVRKGPKPTTSSTDGVVCKWFDDAVKCYGKATALADELGVGESFLSDMRSGKRGIALRHLLPLLGHPEAVLAFVAPMLDSIGYVARPVIGPTFTQLSAAVLADLDDGSPITRRMIENAAAKRGWTPAQVAMALHKEGEDK